MGTDPATGGSPGERPPLAAFAEPSGRRLLSAALLQPGAPGVAFALGPCLARRALEAAAEEQGAGPAAASLAPGTELAELATIASGAALEASALLGAGSLEAAGPALASAGTALAAEVAPGGSGRRMLVDTLTAGGDEAWPSLACIAAWLSSAADSTCMH